MKRYFLTLLGLCFATALLAIPAKRIKRTITLTDGSQVTATFGGDEYLHYYTDASGNRYVAQADGRYAPLSQERLALGQQRRAAANRARIMRGQKSRATLGATSNPVSGQKKGLVILVNFADKALQYTQADFNDYFNKVGYNKHGMEFSVHDYFYRCSYGQFDLTFDVVGPVTVSKNMSYYGSNDADGNDQHPAEMVSEAIHLADKAGVDFTKYDWDGDGEVDQVYVIYAGYGEASGADANTIWPHEWVLSAAVQIGDGDGVITVDGVRVDTYATSNEFRGISGGIIDGIGTACHEFSHCMAIPDFYDTSGNGYFGMDCWDLMDYGCFNGPTENGEVPWEYTSYERMYCGWLTPTELKDPTSIQNMKPLASEPEAYIIYNEGNRNEYYLLENRQQIAGDAYGYGHGMLVLHVDFSADSWMENSVNYYSSHQRMTIVPADGSLKSIGYGKTYIAGDPYPGTRGNTELSNMSTPKAGLFNKNTDGSYLLNHSLSEIKENADGTIAFLFDGGAQLDTPAPSTDETSANAFSISWSAVEGATSYEVRLTTNDNQGVDPEDALLLQENFQQFSGKSTSDIASQLDTYTTMPGWTGEKVYESDGLGAKIGSSKTAGHLTTPTLNCTSGRITFEVELAAYNADEPTVIVQVNNKDAAFFFPTATAKTYIYGANVDGDFTFTLLAENAKERFYISRLTIYDGDFSPEDLTAATLHKRKSQQVFTTTETSYKFTDLNPDYSYSYAVRALSENGVSPWSETIPVSLNTGICHPAVVIEKNAPTYDLSGRRILGTPKGVYIQNGKVLIR